MSRLQIFIWTIAAIVILVIGYWAITPSTSPIWTGFGPYNEEVSGPRSKTLWDWLDLLVVPTFLAVGASILSSIQKQVENISELNRQRQGVLNSFFEQISKLLLEKNLRKSKQGSESRIIARTYARSALRSLDGKRKAELLQFLYEAGLIYHKPIISFNGANLTEARLVNATLANIEIKGAKFTKAIFYGANLRNADLYGCDLSNVNFEKADLSSANLSYTFLNGAILKNLDLTKTNLEGAILDKADLTGSKIRKSQLQDIASFKNAKLPRELIN